MKTRFLAIFTYFSVIATAATVLMPYLELFYTLATTILIFITFFYFLPFYELFSDFLHFKEICYRLHFLTTKSPKDTKKRRDGALSSS